MPSARSVLASDDERAYAPGMSLIFFHRVLIGSAVVFFAGFAAWELFRYYSGRAFLDLALGLLFALVAGLLLLYLLQLKRVLNLPETER